MNFSSDAELQLDQTHEYRVDGNWRKEGRQQRRDFERIVVSPEYDHSQDTVKWM